MYEVEKRMFGDALAEAISRDMERELEACEENARCSRSHIRRVSYIIRHGELPRRRVISKRTWAIIAVAAIVLLCGCTFLGRRMLGEFFMTVYKTRYALESPVRAEDYPTVIEEPKIPHVIPEGYELIEEERRDRHIYFTWQNEKNEQIIYAQWVHDGFYFGTDNEYTQYSEIELCGHRVLYGIRDGKACKYIWMDEYVYYITSTRKLTDSEIENMMKSIE